MDGMESSSVIPETLPPITPLASTSRIDTQTIPPIEGAFTPNFQSSTVNGDGEGDEDGEGDMDADPSTASEKEEVSAESDYKPEGSGSEHEGDEEGDEDDEERDVNPEPEVGTEEADSPPVVVPGRAGRKARGKFALEGLADNPELYGLRRSGRAAAKSFREKSLDDSEETEDDGYARKKKRSSKKVGKSKARAPELSTEESSASSSSDYDDEYGGKSRGKKKRGSKKRKAKMGSGGGGSLNVTDFEMPRIGRNGRELPNYNEEAMFALDDEEDEEEREMVRNEDGDEVEEDMIDSVHDWKLEPDAPPNAEVLPRQNLRYLIKWKAYSHLHNTWESYEYLKRFKGFRKVENYIKAFVEPEIAFLKSTETTPEDIETHNIERERRRNEMEMWKTVERVIDQRNAPAGIDCDREHLEYYIKWQGLQHDVATWEIHDDVASIAAKQIDEYMERISKPTLPHRSAPSTKKRPVFKKIEEEPEYITATGGNLKDFQMVGLNWLIYCWCSYKNGILADEMGLGKTVQTCAMLSYLFNTMQQYGPFLIIVPLSTLSAWQAQIAYWAPALNVVTYIGSSKSREIIRQYEFGERKKPKFNAILTTYEILLKDVKWLQRYKYQHLIVDEAHRLKDHNSQLYQALIGFNTGAKLLITGTPLQNSVKELLCLMHFLHPESFDLNDQFDLEDEDKEEKIKELHGKLETLMLRRLKKDVIKSLPTKSERILRVEMSEMQTKWYKNILSRNYEALISANTQVSLLNVIVELKKCCNHPFLFDGAENVDDNVDRNAAMKNLVVNSGKMILLDKLLQRCKQDGHRVLIFSQMVRMLDILSDYLRMRGYQFQRLDGSTPADLRRRSMDHFNAADSPDFAFLLSTRAGGLGINLETADTVIIFDSDWNPQNDLQAQARAHRIGQKNHVSVYRFLTKGSVEEDVLQRAHQKRVLEHAVISAMDTSGQNIGDERKEKSKNGKDMFSKDELQSILKYGASNIFATDANQAKLEELDLDEVLNQAESYETTQDAAGVSLGGEEFLESLKVQDIKADTTSWDDIIPLEDRERAAQELRKEEALAAALKERRKGPEVKEPPPPPSKDDDTKDGKKGKKKPGPTGARKTAAEKSMSLTTKDLRGLTRSVQRFGDLKRRYDRVVKDAKLETKNRAKVEQAYDNILVACKEALAKSAADLERQKSEGVTITQSMKNKVVTASYNTLSDINAGQFVQRAEDLKILHLYLDKAKDPYQWEMPLDTFQKAQFSETWTEDNDQSLLIGIWLHGMQNWADIEKDEKLGLKGLFALDEGKKGGEGKEKDAGKLKKSGPQGIHLQRRGDTLLRKLREYYHNSTKAERKAKSKKKSEAEDEVEPQGNPLQEACEETTAPLIDDLNGLKDLNVSSNIDIFRRVVKGVGDRIPQVLRMKRCPTSEVENWTQKIWDHVAGYWPGELSGSDIAKLYDKISPSQ
ncbi:hypothetical protein BT69DRAFT_1238228, partial [Atractiella rhizophila]